MKLIISIISIVLATTNFNSKVTQDTDPTFAEFLSHFPLSELPFEIGHNEIDEFTENLKTRGKSSLTPIDNYSMIFEYLPEEAAYTFSRMGRIAETFPIARMYLDEEKIAIVYATIPKVNYGKGKQGSKSIFKKSTNEVDFQKVTFKLQIYDLQGNILPIVKTEGRDDYPVLLASRSIDESCFGAVDINGLVSTTTYENEWNVNPYKKGLKDNEIISFIKLDDDVLSLVTNNEKLNSDSQVASTP